MKLDREYIGVSFAGEDLSGQVLSGTFIGVSFSEANLKGAELCGEFIDVDFSRADLSDASIEAGHFVYANFSQAVMLSTLES